MPLPQIAAILARFARLVCLTTAATAGAAAAQDLRVVSLGTGAIIGNYFAVGRALCAAVNDRGPPDLRCSPEPTPGSHYNLVALASGGMELAIVQSDWQRDAVEGTGDFAQTGPVHGLRSVASLYPEAVTIVVPAESDIDRIDALRGRQVDIGDPSTARRATNIRLLRALGVGEAEIGALPGHSGLAVAEELCARRVDASMIVIGHPSVAIRDMLSRCDLRLLPVERPRLRALIDANPEFSAYTLAADTYAATDRDVPMLAVMATLVVRAGVGDDVVARVARALTEDALRISRRAPVFRAPPAQVMATEGLSAPLHPAAAAVLGAAD